MIVRSPLVYFLVSNMSRLVLLRHDVSHHILATGNAQASYLIFSEWGDRPTILRLSSEDET
ncbi:MAG: hypothetical protein BWY57_02490 [Betaproteobacteria bacterium ADurb.Bin341]|nr:MAG: hypothetical protein BWY57_02490 [Betaproteobacteria bacterium ADurb.Bin341]